MPFPTPAALGTLMPAACTWLVCRLPILEHLTQAFAHCHHDVLSFMTAVQERGRRLQGDLDAALHSVGLLQQEAEKRQEDAARALCAKVQTPVQRHWHASACLVHMSFALTYHAACRSMTAPR